MDNLHIYDSVQSHYSAAANTGGTAYGEKVAKSFGYSQVELDSIPPNANLGLSCGNPFALANLKEGETVIDLGSGAGFDVFLAAHKVGPSGKAIGIDMNKDMLKRANTNKDKVGAENVSFIESMITKIPLPDATADCIISNCVINLVPKEDKPLVFNEMFRLLKRGGRVAVSDILTRRELTPDLRTSMALYVGCIAGASEVRDYEAYLREAGFCDFLIVDANVDLNIYVTAEGEDTSASCCVPVADRKCCDKKPGCCDHPQSDLRILSEARDLNLNEIAGSFKIYAIKP